MASKLWYAAPATKEALSQDLSLTRRGAGRLIALGFLTAAIGLLALLNTFAATMATVFVLAVFLLAGGVLHAIDAFTIRRWNLALLDVLAAVLYFVAAFFIFRQPITAAASITILLSALFMVSGALRFIGALAMQPAHWGWLMAHGAIVFFLGLLLFMGLPVTGLTGPGLLVGVDLFFSGLSVAAFGFAARRLARIEGGEDRSQAGRGFTPAPT